MKFKSIELENFGPYFGANKLNLSTSETAPVILIHGENERGKTSLLHAFRWCLYGKTKNNVGNLINEINFGNWDARDSNQEFTTSVTLVIETEDDEITLKRSFNSICKESERLALRTSETKKELISKKYNAYAATDIDIIINDLLPYDISDFFLFDGELLNEFEQKLSSDSLTQSETIKDSIEKALGLPALTLIVDDLEIIKHGLNKEFREFLKKKGKADAILVEIAQIESSITIKKNNLKELNFEIEQSSARIKEVEPIVRANMTIKEKYEKRDEYKSLIAEAEEVNNTLYLEISQLLGKFWIPSHDLVKKAQNNINEKMEEITNRMFEINREENRRSLILATLEKNKCEVCGQNFSVEKVKDLKNDLIQLEKLVGLDKNLQSRFQDLSARKNQINSLSDAGSESAIIKSKDDLIRGNLIKIEQWKSEVKRLDELLKKISLDESPEKIYSKNLGIFESAQAAIPILRKQIEIEEATLISVSKKLNDINPDESPLQSKIDLIDKQITIFNKSIANFREKMRTDIEKSASKIFRKLTSEKDYGGLQINDKYYMHIVDTNGRIVERRSQGAEQVVTMSLIGALIDCSVREAPVIMDTPLGRLDTVHGSNILKWIPEMSTQVMLFVTSREFSEEIDRPKLGTKIGHEYTLVRESVSRTKIEKTSHGK